MTTDAAAAIALIIVGVPFAAAFAASVRPDVRRRRRRPVPAASQGD